MNLCPKTIHVVGSQKGKGGGADPAFSLLFTRILRPELTSPPSRLIVLFPNTAFVPRFWRIPPPGKQSNPVPSQRLPESRTVFCSNPGTQGIPFQTRCYSDMGIRVLGIPIPKTLGIWASPFFINQEPSYRLLY